MGPCYKAKTTDDIRRLTEAMTQCHQLSSFVGSTDTLLMLEFSLENISIDFSIMTHDLVLPSESVTRLQETQ